MTRSEIKKERLRRQAIKSQQVDASRVVIFFIALALIASILSALSASGQPIVQAKAGISWRDDRGHGVLDVRYMAGALQFTMGWSLR